MTAYRTLFPAVRHMVVGRRIAVPVDTGELTLTVTELDSRFDVRALSAGRLGDVRLAARDLQWAGHRFDHATAVLHGVRLLPSVPPVLSAAPVELTLDVPTAALDGLFTVAAPRLAGEIGPDGVARLRMAGRPGLGHLEVDAQLDGATLWVRPRGVSLRQTRWPLPRLTPAYRVELPTLPHGLQLTALEFAPGLVRLTGTLPQWRSRLPRAGLESVLGRLGVVGRPLDAVRLLRLR
jgi:hypothetical protein